MDQRQNRAPQVAFSIQHSSLSGTGFARRILHSKRGQSCHFVNGDCRTHEQNALKRKEILMSSTDDKATGTANDVVGNVKQVVGNATGNDSMKAEGAAQETKGDAQKALGNAKDAVGGALKNAGDAIKGK